MEKTIKVLDHGYIKYIDHMGSDESIIEAARMSTNRGFEGWDKDSGLLDYLYRHKHSTPFEMCELSIEVQAPVFVFREWHRHRTFSYNELSARYTRMPNIHYVPEKERFLPSDSSNKQAASEHFAVGVREDFQEMVEKDQQSVYRLYEGMLQAGVPKEVARINTPVSRYSRMRAKTDLRNWLGFLNLRMRPNAQYEIRVFAEAVGEIVAELFPRTWSLFEKYDLLAASFSRDELEVLRRMLGNLSKEELETRLKDSMSGEKIKVEETLLKLLHGGKRAL